MKSVCCLGNPIMCFYLGFQDILGMIIVFTASVCSITSCLYGYTTPPLAGLAIAYAIMVRLTVLLYANMVRLTLNLRYHGEAYCLIIH